MSKLESIRSALSQLMQTSDMGLFDTLECLHPRLRHLLNAYTKLLENNHFISNLSQPVRPDLMDNL